jgi:molecular chaperone DnaJ
MALGGEMEVPTFDGSRTLAVPSGTQHGALFRVEGAGLPNLRTGKRGDLVVIAQLVVPRRVSDAQRKLLMELAKIDDVAVNAQAESAWEKIKRKVKGT